MYINDCFYSLDCSKACSLQDEPSKVQELVTHEYRRLFYLFPKPSELVKSHFPEESCFSLLPNYSFDYKTFLESVVIYPFFSAYKLKMLTNNMYDDSISTVYKIRFSSPNPDINFVTIKESFLDNLDIY